MLDRALKNVPLAPHNPQAPDPDDDLFVREYLLLLWRHRFIIAAAGLVFGTAAFIMSWFKQPVYESFARIIVTRSGAATTETTSMTAIVSTYRTLLENTTLAKNVLDSSGLSQPPYNMDPVAFLRRVTVEPVRDTNVIAVKVRMWTPDLAADLANKFVDEGLQLAKRLGLQEYVTIRDLLKVQLDEAEARMRAADDKLQAFKQQAQVDLMRKDAESVLRSRSVLTDLLVSIEVERARLAAAQEELAKQTRGRSVRRAVDSTFSPDPTPVVPAPPDQQPKDPAAAAIPRDPQAAVEATTPQQTEASGHLRSEVLDPYVSPVYDMLEQQIALSRTRLAGFEKQRAELVGRMKLDAPQVATLTELYAREAELARLDTQQTLAKQIYLNVSARYEQARLQAASGGSQLQVLDRARPPVAPMSPNLTLDTLVGVLVGLFLAMLGIVTSNYLARTSERP